MTREPILWLMLTESQARKLARRSPAMRAWVERHARAWLTEMAHPEQIGRKDRR